MDDPATDVTSIVRAYGIEEEFPKSVIKEAQAIPQEITEQPVGKRADFRDLLTVTIDGEDASIQGTDSIGKFFWEHWNYPVSKIDTCRSL